MAYRHHDTDALTLTGCEKPYRADIGRTVLVMDIEADAQGVGVYCHGVRVGGASSWQAASDVMLALADRPDRLNAALRFANASAWCPLATIPFLPALPEECAA